MHCRMKNVKSKMVGELLHSHRSGNDCYTVRPEISPDWSLTSYSGSTFLLNTSFTKLESSDNIKADGVVSNYDAKCGRYD